MTGEPRSRVAVLPDWYEDYFRFATLRFLGRVISGRRIEGGKRTGKWTNGRVAALRWGITGWFAYTVWLLTLSVLVCEVWLGVNVAVLVVWGGSAAYLGVKNWWLRDRILNPLRSALQQAGNLTGWAENERAGRYLHVPLNWNKGDGANVKIELVPGALPTAEKKELFLSVVAATMNATIRPASVSWRLDGKRPYVTIRPAFPPPKVAWFADNVERIEQHRKPGEIVFGVGDHNRLVKVNVTGETPHGALAAQTGRGKSQALADGSCQLLHDGFVGAALDPKGASLRCFVDMPNVVYAGDDETADELVLKLEAEFYRRRDLLKDWRRGEKKPDIGPPIVIMIEEADSLMTALRDLHRRRKGQSTSPAINALLALRNMGRELRMHQLMVTQSGSARAAGSGDGRSQFGWFLVSGDVSTWKKVAPEITKPPAISPTVGRWHLYRNGGITEVQVFGFPEPVNGSEDEKMEEARQYAMSGVVTPVPDNLRLVDTAPKPGFEPTGSPEPESSYGRYFVGAPVVQGGAVAQVVHQLGQAPHLRLVDSDRPRPLTSVLPELAVEPEWLTLSEAMKAGLLSYESMESARSAAKRSALLRETARYRESSGAKEWPRSVLERYARERSNA